MKRAKKRLSLSVLLGLVALMVTQAQAADVLRFVRGSWTEIMEQHRDKPLIVHMWGLTCAPCREELPMWGRLVREKPPVDIVILHAERLPPNPTLVHDMLERSGLGEATTWAFDDTPITRLMREIDPNWRGELPVTMLISRSGLARMAIGKADMGEVRGWIAAQALAAQAR